MVPDGARVLELGSGPGVDLDLLSCHFAAVGSDLSEVFIDRYAASHPGRALLRLDAVTIDTDQSFDAIYSNKVLHHLTIDDMRASLRRQAEVLRPDGVLLHGLWAGEGCEEHEGLRFQHYTEATLSELLLPELELIDATPYEELGPDDSLRVVLKRRPAA